VWALVCVGTGVHPPPHTHTLCPGLTFWTVTVGFPGGVLFRVLWVLNDEAWHWDPSTSVHPRFVTRFLIPFLVLPGVVTLYLVPRFRALLVRCRAHAARTLIGTLPSLFCVHAHIHSENTPCFAPIPPPPLSRSTYTMPLHVSLAPLVHLPPPPGVLRCPDTSCVRAVYVATRYAGPRGVVLQERGPRAADIRVVPGAELSRAAVYCQGRACHPCSRRATGWMQPRAHTPTHT
jgi:hypothetical protein